MRKAHAPANTWPGFNCCDQGGPMLISYHPDQRPFRLYCGLPKTSAGMRNGTNEQTTLGPLDPWTLGPLDPWTLGPLDPWTLRPRKLPRFARLSRSASKSREASCSSRTLSLATETGAWRHLPALREGVGTTPKETIPDLLFWENPPAHLHHPEGHSLLSTQQV